MTKFHNMIHEISNQLAAKIQKKNKKKQKQKQMLELILLNILFNWVLIIVYPEGILVVSSIQLLATDYDALLGPLMKNLVILMRKRLYRKYKLIVAPT